MSAPEAPSEDGLPYRIDLWLAGQDGVERVLARAASAELAQAIFRAALGEYPGRRITVSRGSGVISDSAG